MSTYPTMCEPAARTSCRLEPTVFVEQARPIGDVCHDERDAGTGEACPLSDITCRMEISRHSLSLMRLVVHLLTPSTHRSH